jgi:hypothetical protein
VRRPSPSVESVSLTPMAVMFGLYLMVVVVGIAVYVTLAGLGY